MLRPYVRTLRALTLLVVGAVVLIVPSRNPVTAQSRLQDPVGIPRAARVAREAVEAQSLPLQLTADRTERLLEARSRGLDYVPGEVIVKFRDGMSPVQQQRALMALRSRPAVGELRWIGDAAVLRDPTQPDARILAEQLGEQPEVEYAEPNYLLHVPRGRARGVRALSTGPVAGFTPNDANFDEQWNFTVIDLPRAWDIQPGGSSDLIVAVIDTGLTTVNQSFTFPLFTGSKIEGVSLPYARHPDFDPAKVVGARDFVFAAPGGAVLDMDGHGTHVASSIAEDTNNGLANAGIAYNVKVMPLKVCLSYWDLQIALSSAGIPGFIEPGESDCPTDAIAQAIRHAADNGAKIINISLGGPGQIQSVRNALIYAVQHGAFIAISNGNDFEDGNEPSYPAADAASIDGAMAVAAVGRSLRHARYSSTGSHTEIAAPGGDYDDGGDDGLIWQVTLHPEFVDSFEVIIPRFDVYARVGYEGTSQSAPHVAGIGALIRSQGVTNPAAIEHLIHLTARDLGAPGRDNEFGSGLIQPRAALFGFGIRK